MTGKFAPTEIKVLREIADPGSQNLSWGAGMSLAFDWLRGHGYVRGTTNAQLTEKGREKLRELGT
jgi:hypothetical protein